MKPKCHPVPFDVFLGSPAVRLSTAPADVIPELNESPATPAGNRYARRYWFPRLSPSKKIFMQNSGTSPSLARPEVGRVATSFACQTDSRDKSGTGWTEILILIDCFER